MHGQKRSLLLCHKPVSKDVPISINPLLHMMSAIDNWHHNDGFIELGTSLETFNWLDSWTPLSSVEKQVSTQGLVPTFLRIGTWASQHIHEPESPGLKYTSKPTASLLSGDNAMNVSHNTYHFLACRLAVKNIHIVGREARNIIECVVLFNASSHLRVSLLSSPSPKPQPKTNKVL